jgi:hypothetical protein
VSPATLARRLSLPVLAVLVAGVGAGCGTSGDTADPAAIVPARAPVYLEATVAPEGELRDDALAAGRKLLDTNDPEARLRELLRDRGKGDVEPWLGERVAAFALPSTRGAHESAVIATTSDPDAAREYVQAQGSKTERHRDVELRLSADGTAYALVEDQVVGGQPAAVRAAIDASKGDSLAESDSFKKAFDRVGGEEGIARAYLAPRTLLERSGLQSGAPGAGMLGSLASGALTGALPSAVAARFHADGDAIRADVASVGGAQPGEPADPDFLAGLTGKAWLAAGIGEVGPRLKQQLGALGGSEAMLGLLSAQAGLDIEKDLLGWMGQGAVFVTGTDRDSLGGALVVRSKDPAATRAAIPKLSGLIGRFANGVTTTPLRASGVDAGFTLRPPGATQAVHVAAAGDLFVIALGDDALREAISPSSKLGDDASFRQAAATLGDDLAPTAYVAVQRLAELASASGKGSDQLETYLRRFSALVAADRGDGRWRASLAFR